MNLEKIKSQKLRDLLAASGKFAAMKDIQKKVLVDEISKMSVEDSESQFLVFFEKANARENTEVSSNQLDRFLDLAEKAEVAVHKLYEQDKSEVSRKKEQKEVSEDLKSNIL